MIPCGFDAFPSGSPVGEDVRHRNTEVGVSAENETDFPTSVEREWAEADSRPSAALGGGRTAIDAC